MTTIQIHIPDDLAVKVSALTDNLESYITDLLRSRVQELHLADEYRLASDESEELLNDFAFVDAEGWENEY